ncbi:hypothetical protein ACFS07_21385 [Undibacterium arcticum]
MGVGDDSIVGFDHGGFLVKKIGVAALSHTVRDCRACLPANGNSTSKFMDLMGGYICNLIIVFTAQVILLRSIAPQNKKTAAGIPAAALMPPGRRRIATS